MADPTTITVQLVNDVGTVPPPDDLIAGSKGAVYVDLVKISAAGDYKRGTLMMASSDGYVNATQAGLATAGGICILAEDINVGENMYAETPGYFEGEFNADVPRCEMASVAENRGVQRKRL